MNQHRINNKGPGLNPIDDDFAEDFLVGEEEPLVELPPYDQFICEPPEDDSRTASNSIKFFTKAFKFFSFFLFGGSVFGAALISKASLMVLVNSAKPLDNLGYGYVLKTLDHDIIRSWAYIIILATLLFPEVLSMIYSLYRIIMKPQSSVNIGTVLWSALLEFLHAVGEALLFIRVLPHLDATYALLLMPLVAILPICIHIHAKVLSVTRNKNRHSQKSVQYKRIRNLIMAVLALIFQLGGIISIFGYAFGGPLSEWFQFLAKDNTFIWALLGIILTSIRYWENFISSNLNFSKKFKIRCKDLQSRMDNGRFQTSFINSLIKCSVLIGMTFLIFIVMESDSYSSDYVMGSPDKRHTLLEKYNKIFGLLNHNSHSRKRGEILQQIWYVFAVHSCCSFLSFFFGRVSCMTMIQWQSYTLPNVLVTPVISAISAGLWVIKLNGVSGQNSMSIHLLDYVGLGNYGIVGLKYYIDWNNILALHKQGDAIRTSIANPTFLAAMIVIIGLILGWLGILLITHYLWHNPANRLERMEVLFVKPLYGSPMIDITLLLNRRQYEVAYSKNKQKKYEEEEKKRHEKEERKSSSAGRSTRRRSSRRATISKGHKFVPQLFLCATMWHETEEEMTQILTSLMRLDRDQGSRRSNAPNDDDYYNFQVHVLFDDAMERTKDGKEIKTNKWVHQLCDLIPLAANKVELGKGYDLPPPVIYPTPYGGRLEFIMPHGNLMVVHLKDKERIRHRKRWSQCMYMYYILGYLQATKKAYKLEDVFLLALDGDVDFQPSALLLLLDRMKRNPDVGAACGRIHPTGSGPVVWFQKFEYAVGHWLQKTAEHVLGCVLCSPGCFSLFRGSALVDVNVANMYTTKATEARHYVQWDQGEDRWLCTLLLKQGWRIEYSAASDSFTFAPEDFKEFYNQRRRWGPSTMANIFDILMDAKRAVRNNIYISWGYISYQLGLMVSSLLGPSTVVMIVQGSLSYIFNWEATVALIVSLIPVIIFIILCYTTSADTQVAVAGIMTILYALVMMAVVVGVVGAFTTNILLEPNNLFMLMLVGMYAFTGIMHPQELTCLLHGMLYYLCVPSAFILLMVYSLTNMDNVSWGTREVKKPASEVKNANQQALEQVASKPGQGKNLQVGPKSIYDGPASSDGYYSCGLGNMCQCALCITPKPVVYHSLPATEVKDSQPTRRMSRRPTLGGQNRQSIYKRFSTAKAQQITGIEDEKLGQRIEQSLQKRMSLSQLRRISSRMGKESISTSKLRRMSTHHRRLSRKSTLNQLVEDDYEHQMSEATQALADELDRDPDFDQTLSDDDYSDDDDPIDPERMQEEEEEMLYWLIEGSLEDGVIEYLDNDERDFWKYLIATYLYPLDEDKDEKARIKSDLKDLRNRVTGAYFLLNALWLCLNFALQLTITDIAVIFVINGTTVSVNPVSMVFLVFFLVILIIQFSCMMAHRWSTALHLLSVTSLKWKDQRDGIKNVKNKDLEKEQSRLKMKGKKKEGQNGLAGNGGVRDPLDPLDFSEDGFQAENFTYGQRPSTSGSGQDNPAYDVINLERASSDSSEIDSYGNAYETINMKTKFDKNPANRMFASVNRNYGTNLGIDDNETDDNSIRKHSTIIDLEIFSNKPAPPSRESVSNDEPKQSILSNNPSKESKLKSQSANVHFGPLPPDHAEDGNTSF